MRKWLVNSILLLAVAGNAAMGMPLHSNEESCPMGEMDCCKKAAQAESLTPGVSTARLCCALNCSQSGTSGWTGSQLPRPSTVQAIAIHPSVAQSLIGTLPPVSLRSTWADSPPPYSSPAYIRHLALLI
jgi:hypothetical protein